MEGLFSGPGRSVYWRTRLEGVAEHRGRNHLHRILRRLDPVAASRIGERDKPKIIRALEVRLETGKSLSQHLSERPRDPISGFSFHVVGLNPNRDELYERINERVQRMISAGLRQEVRSLIADGIPANAKALEAIGYRQILAEIDSCISPEETIRIIQSDTRRYAKRQMTWFRKQSEITWFDGLGDSKEIKKRVHQFLKPLVTF
jgi:tRNA dimethylallyltransferase